MTTHSDAEIDEFAYILKDKNFHIRSLEAEVVRLSDALRSIYNDHGWCQECTASKDAEKALEA